MIHSYIFFLLLFLATKAYRHLNYHYFTYYLIELMIRMLFFELIPRFLPLKQLEPLSSFNHARLKILCIKDQYLVIDQLYHSIKTKQKQTHIFSAVKFQFFTSSEKELNKIMHGHLANGRS
jgi:hypothetical protein